MDGRVLGENEGEGNDGKHQGREENGHLVVLERTVFSFPHLPQQAFHHKDAVVHADTVNERGNDNVDEIELQVEDGHIALHHVPADEHGKEGQQGNPDVPEGDEQDDEDEQAGKPQGGGVVVVDNFHHIPAIIERIQDNHMVYGSYGRQRLFPVFQGV